MLISSKRGLHQSRTTGGMMKRAAKHRALSLPTWNKAYGEKITTGFVESAVDQVISKRFVKRKQMRWTKKDAHLLLQVHTKVLNKELRSSFGRWYTKMSPTQEELPLAA